MLSMQALAPPAAHPETGAPLPSPASAEVPEYEVILIGDTGKPHLGPDAVLDLLHAKLRPDGTGAVVFLGDIIYPNGLPPEGAPGRDLAERRLRRQFQALEGFTGKVYFLSGNHDWDKGADHGLEFVDRQEKFVEAHFGGQDVYIPSGGCPGPTEILLHDDLALIAMNTQWWVQGGIRPAGKQYGCSVASEDEFFKELEDTLTRNSARRQLVVGHLPLYSDALHGGRFTLKEHLFPLTIYKRRLWIPLPLFGTLFLLYRKWFGAVEDLSHPRYRRLRKRLSALLADFPDTVYAAGHEHNLQYIYRNGNHYIVSGSGSKVSYVLPGRHSQFARATKGFFIMKVYDRGHIVLEAWEADGTPEGRLLYQKPIFTKLLDA